MTCHSNLELSRSFKKSHKTTSLRFSTFIQNYNSKVIKTLRSTIQNCYFGLIDLFLPSSPIPSNITVNHWRYFIALYTLDTKAVGTIQI